MRIALLCHASLGGSARVATRLAYGLERRGHCVSLVSAAPPPAPAKELSAIRIELFGARQQSRWTTDVEPTWDRLRLAALERHIEAIILRDDIEVVHYHYAWPFAHIVRRLKARLGAASPLFVGTLHGTDVMHAPDGGQLGVLRDTDLLTTVSKTYAELARARLDLDTAPLVIPNFVDMDDFPLSVDFQDTVSERRRPRLVHVSNFRAVKNPEGVARVFAALREQVPAELWLVGEGPGLAELASAIDRAGLGSDTRVLGYQPDIGQTLAQCDVLLMTSWEESFCLAALEAMACGLGVVAPSVGGLTEVAEHGRTAMLFEPGDYDEAVRLTHRLLTERDLRLEIRRRAAERAHDFSARSVVERYEAVYQFGCAQLARPDVLIAGEVS
jgi:N-acetyl-alpha-D-glucosaminyl L-malate synthase BshA